MSERQTYTTPHEIDTGPHPAETYTPPDLAEVVADATKHLEVKGRDGLVKAANFWGSFMTETPRVAEAVLLAAAAGHTSAVPGAEVISRIAMDRAPIGEARANNVGLFRVAGSREPLYYDAAVIGLDEFGHVAHTGEYVSREEMEERMAARLQTQREQPGVGEGGRGVVPVTLTQIDTAGNRLDYSGALLYDAATMTYLPTAA